MISDGKASGDATAVSSERSDPTYHADMSDCWPDTSHGPCPTVMLRHDLPGDSENGHVDWMLAREPEAIASLLSFRLERSLLDLAKGECETAERIQDHRTAYLTYEGPISGNRGTVTRIAEGQLLAVRSQAPHAVELALRWIGTGPAAGEMKLELQPRKNSGNYQVKVLARQPSERYK